MVADKDPLKILIVEDDGLVRGTTKDMLERLGFAVITAGSPLEALAICSSDDEPIDLMMTDMVMPDLSGTELRKRVLSVRPETKILFTSGHPIEIITRDFELAPEETFLQKPFTLKELAHKIQEAMAK